MFTTLMLALATDSHGCKGTHPYSRSFTWPISLPSILSYIKGIDDEYGRHSRFLIAQSVPVCDFFIGNVLVTLGSGR
jgi:hypothetical protein